VASLMLTRAMAPGIRRSNSPGRSQLPEAPGNEGHSHNGYRKSSSTHRFIPAARGTHPCRASFHDALWKAFRLSPSVAWRDVPVLIFVLLDDPANDMTGAPYSCEHAQCRR
jgi:hypothetical protein